MQDQVWYADRSQFIAFLNRLGSPKDEHSESIYRISRTLQDWSGFEIAARQRPSCSQGRDGAPPPSDLRGVAAPIKQRRIRA